jgi:hypothetical protein
MFPAISGYEANAYIDSILVLDATILGNREIYPGQTIAIQVVVQNAGFLQSQSGFFSVPPPLNVIKKAMSATPACTPVPGCNNSTPTATPAASSQQAIANIEGYSGLGSFSSFGFITTPNYGIFGPTTGQQIAAFDGFYYDVLQVNTDPDDVVLATTALGLTCALSSANTPIQVISDPHIVYGALPAGATTQPLTFILRVDRGAPAGVYQLPLTMVYKRLSDDLIYSGPFGQLARYNNYVEECQTVLLTVIVKDMFDLVITNINYGNTLPGSDGVIIMSIKNIGSLAVDEAVAYLKPSSIGPPQDITNYYGEPIPQEPLYVFQGMVVPLQNAQYLGRMGPGSEATVKFKVGISPDAGDGLYPLSVVVSYVDPWGIQKSSNTKTFGVPVMPEMTFSSDEAPVVICCGETGIASINMTNKGPTLAKDAIVRMNALDPFTVSYDTVYLGNVIPGNTSCINFSIKVKNDAIPNTYYVTLEVKYYDENDDPHVTKIIRKPIKVVPQPTLFDKIKENWETYSILGFAGITGLAAGAIGWTRMRKK